MERLKCIVTYDGTYFHGYQVQNNKRTVQLVIEEVLQNIHKGTNVRIYASGRTDATVHARGQVFHFDSPLCLTEERWVAALNSQLPKDVAIQSVEKVSDDFHARFQVIRKEYRYRVLLSNRRDVFRRHYAYHVPYQLSINKIEEAIPYFIGTHDFTSFCSAKTEIEDKVRTIYTLEMTIEEDEIIFRFVGDGFLYNMVRIIVGTLLDVGQGKIEPTQLSHILEMRDRSLAGKTAPGHGLYLWQVSYNN
ncbi:tRNA pseudouridine(38-40) synthase TruA [Ectobacillus sp. sgz5001026]|uniref:tRNA pseudouridine(38-40) synthase TruA n=1 Tax=Ectobacillus sp. sgz5001026 TaxID=3242473 RepID=UPI0036D3B319